MEEERIVTVVFDANKLESVWNEINESLKKDPFDSPVYAVHNGISISELQELKEEYGY